MISSSLSGRRRPSVMALGVGAFAQGMLRILREDGADVASYLTRPYGHFPPSLEGPTFSAVQYPSPIPIFEERRPDLVIPMSIDWAQAPWAAGVIKHRIPLLSPVGEGMRLERERDHARGLCQQYGIPFPKAFVARNRLEAQSILAENPGPYVIKNPLCSPTSPIHTIVCETSDDTRAWLDHLDYAEGIFLQEYMGTREAGHVALVSGGEIYPVVTNQEYKRAFSGNMGIIAGAPLGGIVEADPDDRYGLVEQLLAPLRPWLRQVNYHGPIQVTAIRDQGRWSVLEYNIRLGLTCGPMILRMLQNPLEVLQRVVRNERLGLQFRPGFRYGCSVTLAGYGYPFVEVQGPQLPIEISEEPDCDIWWNEVTQSEEGGLMATGHRIADVAALAPGVDEAIAKAYRNVRRIRSLASYYRTDIGQSGWPPV